MATSMTAAAQDFDRFDRMTASPQDWDAAMERADEDPDDMAIRLMIEAAEEELEMADLFARLAELDDDEEDDE